MPNLPKTLTEIKSLLNRTKSAQEFFGDDPRKTYFALSKVAHPDKNPGVPEAAKVFKQLTELYDSLSMPLATITSPKRTYTLLRMLKAGDVADVRLARAKVDGVDHSYVLKISRVAGTDKVLNAESKVVGAILTKAKDTTYRHYFPTIVESFPVHDSIQKRVNVFVHQPRLLSIEELHERIPALEGRHLAWIFKRLLTALGFAHTSEFIHGAVLPQHVLLDPQTHGCVLIGWGQSVKLNETIKFISKRHHDWYSPEVLDKQPAGPGTDIYMAAKLMLHLAGDVPKPLTRFWQSCLLPSLKMRPTNAWELLDEFTALLKEVYGKPKFVVLNLPD